jgi:FkbM family methyltransferase
MNKLLQRILKAVHLTQHPVYRQGLRQGIAATIEHEATLRNLNVCTVIDVGANKGQFALLARSLFPNAQIHAFEPLEEEAYRFQKLFYCDPNVILHHIALGRENGEADIHLSARSDSSSLLSITSNQNTLFPGTAEIGTRRISVRRGDDVLSEIKMRHPLFIKLDVQGFEISVLEGMPKLLARANYVFAEISFQELYHEQALADELIDFLHERGMRLNSIHNLCTDKDGKAIQADALFQRVDN